MKMRERFFILMVFATLCGVEAYAATAANGLATTGYVDGAVAGKADKSTTLAGYGIGNAYTKTETDTAITNKINGLDATNTVTAGNYITAVNETDGEVAITQAAMDTTPTADSTKPVTSGGVKAALDGKLSTTGTAARATADAGGNNIASTYATKSEMNTGLSGKQATLTTGDTGNIKGTGSVTISKDESSGVITINGVDNDTKYTLPAATDTVRGGVMVDTALSATSTNPVQNKAVKAALDGKADASAIPTVNNATLTIQKNGTTLKTFSANQATNETVNVTVPTKVSELTNDSSYATTGAVALKQDTANMAASATTDVGNMSDADKLKKYPSVALMQGYVAGQIQSTTNSLGDLATKDTVATEDIDNDAVTSAKIANGAVGTDDLATNAVTTVKITDLNVTTAKLAADAVTNAKLADNAVQSENIKDGEVKTADLANGAVTAVKTTGIFGYIPSGSATATATAQIWVQ